MLYKDIGKNTRYNKATKIFGIDIGGKIWRLNSGPVDSTVVSQQGFESKKSLEPADYSVLPIN